MITVLFKKIAKFTHHPPYLIHPTLLSPIGGHSSLPPLGKLKRKPYKVVIQIRPSLH